MIRTNTSHKSFYTYIVTIYTIIAITIMMTENYYKNNNLCIISGILLLFLVVLFDRGTRHITINNKEFVSLLIFLVYAFIMGYMKYGLKTAIGGVSSYVLRFFSFTVFLYLSHNITNKRFNLLLLLIMLSILFQTMRLINLYIFNPGIARMILSGNVEYSIGHNYANPFAIAQGISFISIAILDIFLRAKKSLHPFQRTVLICLVCYFSIVVFLTQSAITTLVMVLGYALSFTDNIAKHRIATIIIMVIMILFFAIFGKQLIANILINSFDVTTPFGRRMNEIGILILYGEKSDDLVRRLELFIQSINTFFDHPLLGNMYTVGFISGNHAEIVDIFSDYGLIGALPLLSMFINFYKHLKNKYNLNYPLIWIPVLITSFLNPLGGTQAYISLLFIVPSIYYLYSSHTVLSE